MLETHQLLTKDLELNPELEAFLNEDRWKDCKNYLTLSIIGAQGTGKSTLINTIFGERFKVKLTDHIGRTTVGANLSIIEYSKDNSFILIDSEGTNCDERLKDCNGSKEEQKLFDARLTSFILSIVDVLLINIMVNQVGQTAANWLELTQKIMEINKKHIKNDEKRKKTIIFVIRDYTEKQYTKEAVKEKILMSFTNSEQEESKNCDNESVSSIEETKSSLVFEENDGVRFEFIKSYIHCEENFIESSKTLCSIIQSCYSKNQNKYAIKDLAYYYNENLKTIFENYKYSAEQLRIYCLKTDKECTKAYENIKETIKSNLELKILYQDRYKIINDSVEEWERVIDARFHDHELFITKIEKLKKRINKSQLK